MNEAPNDWEDRLVDRALQELHGDRPPDLAAAVERALRADAAVAGGAKKQSDGAGGERLTAGTLAAMVLAAAALLCALLSWAWTPRGATWSGAGARFEVAVARGELTLLSADRAPMPAITAGTSATLLIARGDRLHTAAHADTAMNFGPFGSVRTVPSTVLEVVDMDVRTKNGWVTAGSLALAVVAGGASWHFIGSRTSAEPGEVLELHTPGDGALAAELQAARGSGDRLKDENEALRQRIDALEAAARERVATAAAAPPAPAEDATPEVATPATHAPTFEDANFADLLGAVDWEVMGKVAAQMGMPLVELMKKLEAGEELPMELAVEIGKLNMQLVAELPKIMKAGLPGTPGNGVFTHPLIVGNQLASLLQSGNLPLDGAQRAAIGALVRGFSAEASAIQDGPAELDLDRVVAEVAMKDHMYDEIAQQLGPEQRALLYPEGAGNYDGTSLFRSGLIWQQVVSPIEASNPAGYVDTTAANLTSKFHFEGAVADQVRSIVDQTARAAPAEVWVAGSPIERSANGRFLRTGRAMRAAQLQQAWMRRVLREVPLSEQQRKQLRSMQKVFVPVPR